MGRQGISVNVILINFIDLYTKGLNMVCTYTLGMFF